EHRARAGRLPSGLTRRRLPSLDRRKGVRMRRIADFTARILTSGVFVAGGWDALRAPGHRAKAPAKIGLPESEMLVRANGLGMVLAGSAMALGIKPRLAALALAGMLVPTTV